MIIMQTEVNEEAKMFSIDSILYTKLIWKIKASKMRENNKIKVTSFVLELVERKKFE